MRVSPSQIYASWDACVSHSSEWMGNTALGTLRQLKKGVTIYDQEGVDENFYLLRTGFVQASMSHANGRRVLLELMGSGTIFGEGAAFMGMPRYVKAWTLTDVTLSVYSPKDILQNPRSTELLESLIKILATKQRIFAEKLLNFGSEGPEGRMRALLNRVFQTQLRASVSDPARAAQIWISQESLGDMCGMSRISAARALKRLSLAGAIRTTAHYVEVINPAQLTREG